MKGYFMGIIKEIIQLFSDRTDFFIQLLIQHIILSGISIVIITFIGIALGVLISENKSLATLILALTNFFYTIPSIALFGFLVAITGIGAKSAIVALVIYGLLPIIRNTYVGLVEIDPQIIDAALGMGSTELQLLRKVRFPLALPMIFAGFRNMVVMTISLAGIASFIGAGGLGVAIWRGITTNYPAMTIAGSLIVALLAILSDVFLGLIEKKVGGIYHEK
jgi:osmoprotectant transport system permease protein